MCNWTPITEAPPPDETWLWVTYEQPMPVGYKPLRMRVIAKRKESGTWIRAWGEMEPLPGPVLAWAPLPEPWDGDAQEPDTTPAARVIETLTNLPCGDNEAAHMEADKALLKFVRQMGWGQVADEWETAQERIGFWYA